MTEQIVRIRAGEPIPEWLIVAEPRENHRATARGNWRFNVDCDVVEMPDRFVVVPVPINNQPILDIGGISGCNVFAPTKRVDWAVFRHQILPLEVQGWQPLENLQSPPATLDRYNSLRPAPPLPAPQPVPDPHRGLWARLRYVLTGR